MQNFLETLKVNSGPIEKTYGYFVCTGQVDDTFNYTQLPTNHKPVIAWVPVELDAVTAAGVAIPTPELLQNLQEKLKEQTQQRIQHQVINGGTLIGLEDLAQPLELDALLEEIAKANAEGYFLETLVLNPSDPVPAPLPRLNIIRDVDVPKGTAYLVDADKLAISYLGNTVLDWCPAAVFNAPDTSTVCRSVTWVGTQFDPRAIYKINIGDN